MRPPIPGATNTPHRRPDPPGTVAPHPVLSDRASDTELSEDETSPAVTTRHEVVELFAALELEEEQENRAPEADQP